MKRINLTNFCSMSYKNALRRFSETECKDVLNMLKHCNGEVVESMDAYKELEKISVTQIEYEQKKKAFAMELADIITCVLTLSYANNIDIEQALIDVYYKNATREDLGVRNGI